VRPLLGRLIIALIILRGLYLSATHFHELSPRYWLLEDGGTRDAVAEADHRLSAIRPFLSINGEWITAGYLTDRLGGVNYEPLPAAQYALAPAVLDNESPTAWAVADFTSEEALQIAMARDGYRVRHRVASSLALLEKVRR
jgi:hypothetical protein